jgi:hypothetical protein
MPQQRMEIRVIKDILRLKYSGKLSHEAIARSLSISKGVVAKYLGLAGAAGLDWEATAQLDEAGLERRLLGRSWAEWPASTILAARRQLSWPVEAGEFIDGQGSWLLFPWIPFLMAIWQAKRVRP